MVASHHHEDRPTTSAVGLAGPAPIELSRSKSAPGPLAGNHAPAATGDEASGPLTEGELASIRKEVTDEIGTDETGAAGDEYRLGHGAPRCTA